MRVARWLTRWRWPLPALACLLLLGILLLDAPSWLRRGSPAGGPGVYFVDITERAGVRFVHENGAAGRKLLPETMGSGVAVLDFDNDGRPDLLFVNGRPWPGQERPGAPLPTLALYRNSGDGTFQEVTRAANLDVSLFGMGVTIGDFDNDGWVDFFVTGVGGNHLFHNEPAEGGANGRAFRDVTARAGVGGPGGWPSGSSTVFLEWKKDLCWSSSAAFLDYDGDGLLDLFVGNYVTWSPAADVRGGFEMSNVARAYGPPRAFGGTHCFLYRNKGDGSFEDVTRQAGVEVFAGRSREGAPSEPAGKALGVVTCDIDGDGWPDVAVGNDTVRNFLFRNVRGPGGTRVFDEVGLGAGVAYSDRHARGAMGIDWLPGYRPGRGALLIANFADEPDTLLVQQRPGQPSFVDLAPSEGVAGPSRPLLKFGAFFFDYDNDGLPDLLTCNGHLEPDIALALPDQSYAQPVQLFRNRGDEARPRFELVGPDSAGPDLFRPLVGRGCAYLDLDGDGDLDVVLTANSGPARVLRNEGGTGHHWVRLRLEGDGKRSNKSAIGARVVLEAGGRVQEREVAAARGYLSASELALTFGLGQTSRIDRVTIYWPGASAGPPQVLTGLEPDREHVVRQGDS